MCECRSPSEFYRFSSFRKDELASLAAHVWLYVYRLNKIVKRKVSDSTVPNCASICVNLVCRPSILEWMYCAPRNSEIDLTLSNSHSTKCHYQKERQIRISLGGTECPWERLLCWTSSDCLIVLNLPNVDLMPTPKGSTVLSTSSNDHLSDEEAEEVDPNDCFFRSMNAPFLNPNSSSQAFASGLSKILYFSLTIICSTL